MAERKATTKRTTKRITSPATKAPPRTQRFAPPEEAPADEAPAPAPAASAPTFVAPAPAIVEAAPPAPPTLTVLPSFGEREWVPVVYEGQGMVVDADAGVFVRGTRTRLRGPTVERLLGIEGFRLAG